MHNTQAIPPKKGHANYVDNKDFRVSIRSVARHPRYRPDYSD
jgi:hypothetical protein